MKIIRYAQSTIQIENEGKKVLIDPGSYNFEPGRLTREDFKDIDVLIVTHKHGDHFDLQAVKTIHDNSNPIILTVKELATVMEREGIASNILNVGQSINTSGFYIEAIKADHVVNGEIIDIFGVIVEANGKRIYHTSDTVYMEEKPSNIDLIFVPINNRGVAMDFEDAARFVREIDPKTAVPVHYDSPKDSHINPSDWANLLKDDNIEVTVMAFGESLEL